MDHCNSLHPRARAHHRPGYRSISPFDINAIPSDARIRSSIFAHAGHAYSPDPSSSIRTGKRIALGHSYPSDSKIWPKRKAPVPDEGAKAVPSLYARVFRLVFAVCLVLFLRALSGAGVRESPEPGCEQECDEAPVTSYSQPVRGGGVSNIGERAPMQVQYDYLAIDPDGHYSYTSAENDEHRAGYWRRWGRRGVNHAMPDSNAKPEIDVDEFRVPKSTSDVLEDVASALETPPPVASIFTPPNSETVFQNYPVTQNGNGDPEVVRDDKNEANRDDHVHEAGEDLAMRLFSPGYPVPVYPLRIHLSPLPEAGNHLGHGARPGWGRKHGKVSL